MEEDLKFGFGGLVSAKSQMKAGKPWSFEDKVENFESNKHESKQKLWIKTNCEDLQAINKHGFNKFIFDEINQVINVDGNYTGDNLLTAHV